MRALAKDLIIRGGENIVSLDESYRPQPLCPRLIPAFCQDAVSIENALYEDGRVLSCATVAVPDARLGELPVTFVVPKPGVQVAEVELLEFIRPRSVLSLPGFHSTWDILCYIDRICRLAAFAVPVMLVISTDPLSTNAAGKNLKTSLREKATDIWEQRKKSSKMPKAKL